MSTNQLKKDSLKESLLLYDKINFQKIKPNDLITHLKTDYSNDKSDEITLLNIKYNIEQLFTNETKDSQTIVDADKNHIFRSPLLSIKFRFRTPTFTIATTMNPQSHW